MAKKTTAPRKKTNLNAQVAQNQLSKRKRTMVRMLNEAGQVGPKKKK